MAPLRLACPRDTGGWKVLDRAAGRLYLAPDGTGYRELRQVDGARPDVVLTYRRLTTGDTWLRALGPRQLAEWLDSRD